MSSDNALSVNDDLTSGDSGTSTSSLGSTQVAARINQSATVSTVHNSRTHVGTLGLSLENLPASGPSCDGGNSPQTPQTPQLLTPLSGVFPSPLPWTDGRYQWPLASPISSVPASPVPGAPLCGLPTFPGHWYTTSPPLSSGGTSYLGTPPSPLYARGFTSPPNYSQAPLTYRLLPSHVLPVSPEAAFTSRIFDGIPGFQAYSTSSPTWYSDIPTDQRILACMRFLKALGFAHIGEFLAVLLSSTYTHDPSVVSSITAWLQGRTHANSRPVDIMHLVYSHTAAREARNNNITYYTPDYSCSPSPENEPPPSLPPNAPARVALANWAFNHILKRVNVEADKIADCYKSDGAISWDSVNGWDMKKEQKRIFDNVGDTLVMISILF